MKNVKYTLIQVLLILGIIILTLLVYRSISRPQKFNVIYETRKKR